MVLLSKGAGSMVFDREVLLYLSFKLRCPLLALIVGVQCCVAVAVPPAMT